MIADASVLIVFSRGQRLDLLRRTVGTVGVTRAVRDEAIGAAPRRPDAASLVQAFRRGHIVAVGVTSRRIESVIRRYPNLGRGEASVLAAALQRGEREVLIDERAARRAATLEGLQPVGSLGVLARARRMGVLKSNVEVAAAVRDVLSAGLWVAPDVVEAFWGSMGGRP